MNKSIIFMVMVLAVLALIISGCAPKEATTSGAASETPESAELTEDLDTLEDLDALASEDLDLKELDNLNLE